MKRYLIKFIFFWVAQIMAYQGFCQLLPFQDDDNIITPSFNFDVISSKSISCLTVNNVVKLSNSPMMDEGVMSRYYFDSAHRLSQSYYTIKQDEGSWDTIRTMYYYSKNGNLIVKRTAMADFYDTWYYSWNEEGQILKDAHVHETADVNDGDYKVETQKIISCDSFNYVAYPKQIQQYAYNEDNKIFRKTIYRYDENKRLINRNCQYAVGWLYSQVSLDYDSKGRIAQFIVSGNINGEKSITTTVMYDSTGHAASESVWDNGKQIHKIDFMYDKDTGLLSDILDMKTENQEIDIQKFSYETMYNISLTKDTRRN